MACVFCTNPPDAGEVVFEDDVATVHLHPDSSVRGHAMVAARQHVENASDLNEEHWLHMQRIQRLAERALLDETNSDRAILLKLGIQTPHLHVHIYPLSARLDRAAVMDIIDGRVREERDETFAERVRARLLRLTRTSA